MAPTMDRDTFLYRSVREATAHLAQADQPLASSWLYALSGAPQRSLEPLAAAWPQIAPQRRQEIARTLVEMGEASFEVDFNAVFRLVLADPDAEVRRDAVEGLWEDEDPALIRRFLSMLRQDPAATVRESAAVALGRFLLLAELEEIDQQTVPEIAGPLLEKFHDLHEDPAVRRRALESVAYWGDERAREAVEEAYHAPQPEMRQSAVFAMGRSADPCWRGTVVMELSNPLSAMRYEAAVATGELEVKQGVPKLAELVMDPDREVQEAALWALGRIGGDKARKVLQACVQQADPILVQSATEALEELEMAAGFLSPDFPDSTDGFPDEDESPG